MRCTAHAVLPMLYRRAYVLQRYKESLVSAIRGDTSGDTQKFFLGLVQVGGGRYSQRCSLCYSQ